MLIDFSLKKLSGHSTSGKVGKIHRKIGDQIEIGDELLDIESSKGNSSVVSDVKGVLKSIAIETGDNVKIGDLLFRIEEKEVEKEITQESKEEPKKPESKQGTFNYMGSLMKPKKEELEADITVIGAGPGGYVAAIQAAKLGAKVVIVEKEAVGGTCLNWGCIPTKAFVRSAEILKNINEAESYGLKAEKAYVDINKVVQRKNDIVKNLVGGIGYLLEKNNVRLLKGKGELIDSNTVFLKEGNKEVTIKTKNIIIATGSKTAKIPIKGIDSPNVVTSKEILDIPKMPKRLVVIGGGVIGMEFAFIFKNFGIDVTVVEYADNILASLDQDVCDEITSIAMEKGIKVYTGSKVVEVIDTEDGDSIVAFEKDDTNHYVTGDKILLSVGRIPNVEDIDITKLKIGLNDNGKGIKVNEKLQTNVPNIYAIGDVTNKVQLAHVASHQGIVAVENIIGESREMDYNVIPSAIFTDPEIAVVGMDEKTANENNIEVVVGKFPFAANGKALTLGEDKGFVKIIKEKSTRRIIGGAIIGPHATDLIHEIAVAIQNGLKDTDLIHTIHGHPTTAEAIHEAVLATTNTGALHYSE